MKEERILLGNLLTEMETLFKDEFVAMIRNENNLIVLHFLNRQKFEVAVKEC